MTILALSVSGQFIEFIGAKSSEESLSNSQASDKSQPNQLEPDRKQSVKKFWVKDPKKKTKKVEEIVASQLARGVEPMALRK